MQLVLIALIGLLSVSCAHASKDTQTLDFTQSVPSYCTSGETDPPEDCECWIDGKFDENIGTDTLDCGNLPQVK